MVYLLLGGLGFLVGYALELAPVQRLPGAKPVAAAASLGLLTISLVMVSLSEPKFPLPAWLSIFGGAILPLSLFLLAYSLFLELPFRRTYVAHGPDPYLITTSTYALVRHPTVLWYALLLIALLLLTRSQLLLIALPLWLALDILWVVLQEKLSLPRAFPRYSRYQRETPMLVPSLHSLRACLATLRFPRRTRADAPGR